MTYVPSGLFDFEMRREIGEILDRLRPDLDNGANQSNPMRIGEPDSTYGRWGHLATSGPIEKDESLTPNPFEGGIGIS